LLFSSRRAFLWAALPFLLCLALYAGAFAALVAFDADLVDLILEPGSWWRTAVRAVLTVALWGAVLVLMALAFSAVCFAIAGPLYELLSCAVEKALTGTVQEEPFSFRNMVVDIARGMGHALVILVLGLVIAIAGLLFFPVTTVLAFLASAVLLSVEYLDYPMGRRRMDLKQKVRFARENVWEMLGLGVPLLAGLMIPFVAVVFLPVGVAGGTLLFVRLTNPGSPPARD
jgi:CysZ protein